MKSGLQKTQMEFEVVVIRSDGFVSLRGFGSIGRVPYCRSEVLRFFGCGDQRVRQDISRGPGLPDTHDCKNSIPQKGRPQKNRLIPCESFVHPLNGCKYERRCHVHAQYRMQAGQSGESGTSHRLRALRNLSSHPRCNRYSGFLTRHFYRRSSDTRKVLG
jgi:hypothetical protein